MKKLVVNRPDGGVSIIIPAPNAMKELGMDEPTFMAWLKARHEAEGATIVAEVDGINLPDDSLEEVWYEEAGQPVKRATGSPRAFRNDWVWDGNAVVTDPVKKVERKKAFARACRNKLLSDSDIDMTIATERGAANQQALKNYRQALRDLGTDIDADPDTLSWPTKP